MKRILLISQKRKKQFLLALLSGLILSSCWYNRKWEDLHPSATSAANCDTSGVISYSATIQPFIAQNCATPGCHVNHGGSTDYTQYVNVVTDASLQNGNQFAYRMSLPTSNALHMPQGGGFMAACDTLKLRKWIYAGCPQN